MDSKIITTNSEDWFENSNDSFLDEDFIPSADEGISEITEENGLEECDNEMHYEDSEALLGTSQENYFVPASRWRHRNEHTYNRHVRKHKRNSGQKYVCPETNKIVASRKLGPPCCCALKCRNKLNGMHETIFKKFWELGSYDLQNSYLFGCISVFKKQRSYKKKTIRQESRRKNSVRYYIHLNGTSIKICKIEFLSLHGLQNSRGRLDNIIKTKTDGAVVPHKDGRGKHTNRHNKLSDDDKNRIPKYQSHCSRGNNIN